jgi:hypothetical protein
MCEFCYLLFVEELAKSSTSSSQQINKTQSISTNHRTKEHQPPVEMTRKKKAKKKFVSCVKLTHCRQS